MNKRRIATVFLSILFGYLLLAELYVHLATHFYHQIPKLHSAFLQKTLIFTDINRFMDPRNHDDVNSDGIRFHREANDIKPEDTSIIFLGNSFMYGFMLSHRAAMPYQFEEMARAAYPGKTIHGINFGWVSASPYIELNLLKKIGKKYQPDVVIVDVDLNDFYNDILYQQVDEGRSIYALHRILPFTTFLVETGLSHLPDESYETITGIPKSQLYFNERPLEASLPYLERYTEKNLDALYDYSTRELGAKFIVFVNPKTFHYNENESPNNWLKDVVKRTEYSFEIFEYVDALAKEKPYPVISLLPAFQRTTVFPTAFEKDAHWNRDGYKIAATEMLAQCQKLGCFNQAH